MFELLLVFGSSFSRLAVISITATMKQEHQAGQMNLQAQSNQVVTLVESFLETKQSPETIRAYRRDINQFMKYSDFGSFDRKAFFAIEKEVMVEKLSAFVQASKSVDPVTGRCMNVRSVNRRMYALSSFFRFLTKKYDYSFNPVAVFDPLPAPSKSSTISPSKKEIKQLLRFLMTYPHRGSVELRNTVFILHLFLLALRCTEARTLRWSNIDTEMKVLRLIQKGGTQKLLPIPSVLLNLLNQHKRICFESWKDLSILRDDSKKQRVLGDSEGYPSFDQTFVFANNLREKNKPISKTTASNIVTQVCKEVFPQKHFTPHSFRKAFIEQALNSKADLVSIINATGHTSTKMISYYDTRDIIKHNAIHDVSRMVEKIQGEELFHE